MNKRVGITINIEEKEKLLKENYKSLVNFNTIRMNLNYEQALHIKGLYEKRGYEALPVDETSTGSLYSVFTFEF